jgi:hypothetical protein
MIIYNVFARKEYPEPLTYIGSIEADSDDTAIEGSLKEFGENDWIEMLAVPQQEIITVFSAAEEE